MRERGFTLVEIIIGAFILGMATIGIYKAMASYMDLTKTQTEVQRMEKLKKAMNLDLMNGILPDNSNFNNLLSKWLGENTYANNYGNPYYLILPSGLSLGQDQNLCALVDNLSAVFKIRMPNGEIIDNVIYLLVSPTGKGENTIQRNNLSSNSSVIKVSSGATINISEYDIVRYMTKDSYKSGCIELARKNEDDCKRALEEAGFLPGPVRSIMYYYRTINNWNNVVQACSGRNAFLYFDVAGGDYGSNRGGRTIIKVPISRLNSPFIEIIPHEGTKGYSYSWEEGWTGCGGDYSGVHIRTSSGTHLLVVAAGANDSYVGYAGNKPGTWRATGLHARICLKYAVRAGGYGWHWYYRPGSYVNTSLAQIVFERDGGNTSFDGNGYVYVWYRIED